MERWFVYAKKADFKEWAEYCGVDQVLARIIRNRDIQSKEEADTFLHGRLEDCHSPWLLLDMEKAVDHILRAVQEKKRIRIIGDYDVDGICASYILTKGIELLGGEVDTAIPHRIYDGYGLNENLIREAAAEGVKLIVTCDNGISAGEQTKLAAELGMDVIITDHHEVPYVMEGEQKKELLPQALAVVDPKRAEDAYPFSGICGGVVAYKLIRALTERISEGKTQQEEEIAVRMRDGLEELLEFAALATVCDVMELKDENRIIVREGLRRLKKSRNRGLRALLEVNAIPAENVSAYHLGFVIGPCLNATGRLDTAERGLELLRSTTDVEAMNAARDLKELNDSRKNMTLQGVEQAKKLIEDHNMERDKVLVVFLPEIHESLAGIIAGRVREYYGHPAFVLTRAQDGVKGSGRSIEQYSMYEALTRVSSLLTKFGGHKLAAGLSLEEQNVGQLREALNQDCSLTEEDFIPKVHIEMELPLSYVTPRLTQQLELLEPFGVGNARPLFVQRNLIFLSGTRMGKEGQYGRFQVQAPDGTSREMVFFGDMDSFCRYLEEKYGEGSAKRLFDGSGSCTLHAVYQVQMQEYRGNRKLQFQLKYYQ